MGLEMRVMLAALTAFPRFVILFCQESKDIKTQIRLNQKWGMNGAHDASDVGHNDYSCQFQYNNLKLFQYTLTMMAFPRFGLLFRLVI